MRYVTIYKDLSRVERKVIAGLTKRQLICLGSGAIVGFLLFWNTRRILGIDAATCLMIAIVLPFFFLGIYKDNKTGLPLEKTAALFLQAKFIRPRVRPFHTENLYAIIQYQINKEKEARHRANHAAAYKSHHRETVRPGGKGRSKR